MTISDVTVVKILSAISEKRKEVVNKGSFGDGVAETVLKTSDIELDTSSISVVTNADVIESIVGKKLKDGDSRSLNILSVMSILKLLVITMIGVSVNENSKSLSIVLTGVNIKSVLRLSKISDDRKIGSLLVVKIEEVSETMKEVSKIDESVSSGVSEIMSKSEVIKVTCKKSEKSIVEDGVGLVLFIRDGEGLTLSTICDKLGLSVNISDGEGVSVSKGDCVGLSVSKSDGEGLSVSKSDGERLSVSKSDGEGLSVSIDEASNDWKELTVSTNDNERLSVSTNDNEILSGSIGVGKELSKSLIDEIISVILTLTIGEGIILDNDGVNISVRDEENTSLGVGDKKIVSFVCIGEKNELIEENDMSGVGVRGTIKSVGEGLGNKVIGKTDSSKSKELITLISKVVVSKTGVVSII